MDTPEKVSESLKRKSESLESQIDDSVKPKVDSGSERYYTPQELESSFESFSTCTSSSLQELSIDLVVSNEPAALESVISAQNTQNVESEVPATQEVPKTPEVIAKDQAAEGPELINSNKTELLSENPDDVDCKRMDANVKTGPNLESGSLLEGTNPGLGDLTAKDLLENLEPVEPSLIT
jgi:hypothetical protein